MLTLGLWPFHPPRNEVSWLGQTSGVFFGRNGTIFGELAINDAPSEAFTVEMWVQPEKRIGGTLVSLYRSGNPASFAIEQSLDDLEIKTPAARFYVDGAFTGLFKTKKPIFVSVTAGSNGTAVYLDGRLVKNAPGMHIGGDPLSGKIIVGDSPRQPYTFRGKILGLAIYRVGLEATEMMRHFRTWSSNGRPEGRQEDCVALFLFDEKSGKTVHNYARPGSDLSIPETYAVADKMFLEPFWEEFDFSSAYWKGNLKNVVGFLPVGFCFYAYFIWARPVRRPIAVTLALGFLISMTIEVLQAFLPTRDSGTTDLFTNTLGTWLGVVLFAHAHPFLARNQQD